MPSQPTVFTPESRPSVGTNTILPSRDKQNSLIFHMQECRGVEGFQQQRSGEFNAIVSCCIDFKVAVDHPQEAAKSTLHQIRVCAPYAVTCIFGDQDLVLGRIVAH